MFFSCKTETDDLIFKHIESIKKMDEGDSVLFEMPDALQVDYDTGYLFGEGTRSSEISKIIEIPYSNEKFITDSKYRVILIKNDKIVYENDFYQRRIEFDLKTEQDSIGMYVSYKKFTAHIFQAVKKNSDSHGTFYKLTPSCK